MLLKVNTNPSPREVRMFGVTLLIAFSIIAALLYFRGKPTPAFWIWSIATPIALLAILLPKAAWVFYVSWMGLAFVMGSIMSRVIMSFLFLGIITPVAFIFRCMGRDALQIKKKPDGQTYWTVHKQNMDARFYDRLS